MKNQNLLNNTNNVQSDPIKNNSNNLNNPQIPNNLQLLQSITKKIGNNDNLVTGNVNLFNQNLGNLINSNILNLQKQINPTKPDDK